MAGSVLLGHVLLVWLALLARSASNGDEATPQLIVTSLFDLPPVQAPLPAESKPIPLQLKQFTSSLQDIPVEQLQIEAPETEEPATVADVPHPAAAPTGQVEAGSGEIAGDPGGRSGAGNALVLLQRVLPPYPRAAARRGERGITRVLLHVTQSGRVDQVRVEQGSGSKLLDEAAVDAFRRWRFQQLPETAVGGKWLRTDQRFVLYQFTYSRLDADAMEYVYGENLKPKGGEMEAATPGGREALLRFIEQVRSPAFDAQEGASAGDLALLRANLGKWGATKSVEFRGIVGSGRWLRHGTKSQLRRARSEVEVSWNAFDVKHEHGTSEWLIAMDHNGDIWAAQAASPPE